MGCNASAGGKKPNVLLNDTTSFQPTGSVEVHGVTASMNCMGPILLATASQVGKMVACVPGEGTRTPEFTLMNPFRGVPTLRDGELYLGESSAILRYLAEAYAPEAYSKPRQAFVDWAMAHFASQMYADAAKTLYVCLGYSNEPPEDAAKAGKECSERLTRFAEVFLKEKFVGGEKLSIADYRVAPFFFAYGHPVMQDKFFVDAPERIKQFNKDFAEACSSSDLLIVSSGQALKEKLDARLGFATEIQTDDTIILPEQAGTMKEPETAGKGKVKVFGEVKSADCAGLFMFLRHAELGEAVELPAAGSPELTEVNPFQELPALKDGAFSMANADAILCYLARSYAPEFFPEDLSKRAFINWAMDRFSTALYEDAKKTIFVVAGLLPAPTLSEDLEAAGKAAANSLDDFADFFLKSTFIGGESPCIADFRVAPFLAAFAHPALQEKCGLEVPERIAKFNQDFAAACEASVLLREAGGKSIKEHLDRRLQNSEEAQAEQEEAEQEEAATERKEKGAGAAAKRPGTALPACACVSGLLKLRQ